MNEKLYVKAEIVIVNLLKEERRSFVDMSEIFKLCSYVEDQLRSKEYIDQIQSVYFDVNFDSIERTVRYNDYMFDLIGERIYLKQTITQEIEMKFVIQPLLRELIRKFVTSRPNATPAY